MRIGIVWPEDYPLARTTVRFERYLQGFQALGHDALIAATEPASAGFPFPTWKVPSLGALRTAELWESLNLDAALVCTWLGKSDILEAARPHVRCLLSLSDSDGCVGVRVHPWSLLRRMWGLQRKLSDRLRTTRWWLSQFLGLDVHRDNEVLASCRLADQIIVFSPGAGESLASFFRYHGQARIEEHILVAPYPVAEELELSPVETTREDCIVAIGRWDDPQKDVGLLVAALKLVLRQRPQSRCIVLGPGGDGPLQALQAEYPDRVECPGPVPPTRVREALDRSRCLLSTSRWESGPIVAAEALLRGCSLVGPRSIPSFRQFCRGSDGTTFARRSPAATAAALTAELQAWDAGQRDPEHAASAWHGYFTPLAVCERLLAGFSAAASEPDGWARPTPRAHASLHEAPSNRP
jgi:glycosyltransferase involved in cell wall biosynthesis